MVVRPGKAGICLEQKGIGSYAKRSVSQASDWAFLGNFKLHQLLTTVSHVSESPIPGYTVAIFVPVRVITE